MATLDLRGARQQLAVMRQAEGFFASAVLFALTELGVFAALRAGPLPIAGIHQRTGGDSALLEAVLDAAVALELLRHGPSGYECPEPFRICLSDVDDDESLVDWIMFLRSCMEGMASLADGIRTGVRPLQLLSHDSGTAGATLTAAMQSYSRTRARELPLRIGVSGVRSLVDLGAGPGTYAFAFLDAVPDARATLVDGPESIAAARQLASRRSLSSRVDFVEGDLFEFSADPDAFDLVLISNVLHVIGPEAAAALLRRAFAMTSAGGRIVVQAQHLDDARRSPRWPVLLNLLQVAGTRSGRNHTVAETTAWVQAAGFINARHIALSAWNVNSCVVAWKP